MTQRPNEDLVIYRNRASNYAKIIERFHGHLIDKGYKINTAKSLTNGIRQLFRYYQMDSKVRSGSKLNRTVKTQRNFPEIIEHIRKMHAVTDSREISILSIATDLGLRIGDLLEIKKGDLPDLPLARTREIRSSSKRRPHFPRRSIKKAKIRTEMLLSKLNYNGFTSRIPFYTRKHPKPSKT